MFPNYLNKENISIIRRIFKDNIEILEIDDCVQNLKNLRLIKLNEGFYVKCAKRSDQDYTKLTEDQRNCTGKSYIYGAQEISECQSCNRQILIEGKEKFKFYTISINYNNAIEILRKKIGENNTLITNNNSHIIITDNDGKEHTLCILDLCENIDCKTNFYYSDEILYIYCDVNVGFDAPNIIWLFDLLIKEPEQLYNFIITATPMINSGKIEEVMKEYIDDMSWQKFEVFIPRLLNHIRANPNNYNKGLSFLQKYSGTIISSFNIKISGSGKTDAYSINLLEYLQTSLESDIRIECKHSIHDNIGTSITLDELRVLMDHSFQKKGVIFTNRNKISGSAINRCIEIKENSHQWIYVIIHRPLLKLIISMFLDEFWNDPKFFINSLNIDS